MSSLYRNPIEDVRRFFELYHPHTFRIYNCCPEMYYSSEYFGEDEDVVVRFQVQDHTPPTLNDMFRFLQDAGAFMSEPQECAEDEEECSANQDAVSSSTIAGVIPGHSMAQGALQGNELLAAGQDKVIEDSAQQDRELEDTPQHFRDNPRVLAVHCKA